MGEIVNLRRHRKHVARRAREDEAKENRTRFGCPVTERKAAEAEAERAARNLDGHRLDTPDDRSS